VSRDGASVLVLSPEPVGAAMAGPAIRAWELARALSARCPVTLAAPAPSEPPERAAPGAAAPVLLEAGLADFEQLVAAFERHDVVVAQRLPGQLLRAVARSPARLVLDLYNALPIEVLEAAAAMPERAARRSQRIVTLGVLANLAVADLVLCASERQRDLWLGGMAFGGLLDPARYRGDPSFRSYVEVVPFGVPDGDPPQPAEPRPWPGIASQDRVLVWGGGVWRWLDPITPIRAVELLRRERDDVHLVFLGTGRPVAAEGASAAGEAAREAERLGLLGAGVHLNPGWEDYAARGPLLAAADIGVSAHHDHLETRFSFRTRIVDYLWAGLPVVTSRGDVLGDMVAERGLGAAVAPGDPAEFARACRALLDDDGLRERAASAARRVAEELRWSRVAEPLVRWCADPPPEPPRRGRAAGGALALGSLGQQGLQVADVFQREGATEVARRASWALGRAVRRASRRGRGAGR
jgi:glycosyltransferase involved in cell wall biosynthesis